LELSNYYIDRVIVAIDGLRLKGMKALVHQFYTKHTLRELNKAYIGFKGDSKEEERKGERRSVTTGRWGCGAYNGNSELK
jgi:hypothetical protein